MCMLSWREEGVVLLAGGEAVLVTTLWASSTLYSYTTYSHSWSKADQPTFGLVILARFFPWLIELCAELLLKIVILFGPVS